MNQTIRNIVFSLITTLLFFGLAELYLHQIQYEGTSISDLVDTAGFPDNSYVHKRDRILGPWFLKTPNGYRSNPDLRSRGFHKETFLDSEKRIFAMGGSTTYGSPFEHEERGFPHRLQKKQRGKLRIINAGVAGMDSSAFPMMSLQLQNIGAEKVIIYAGNNEIRGALLSMCTSEKSIFSKLHLYRWIQDTYRQYNGFHYTYDQLAEHQEDCIEKSALQVVSQVQHIGGDYRQDELYIQLLSSFKQNLSTTIQNFAKSNIPVILVIPPINLYQKPDYTYTKSTKIQTLEYEQNWKRILQLVPTHARANYEIGIQSKNIELLRRAAEYDYTSRRITPSLQKALLEICQKYENNVRCIDMRYIEEDDTQQFFVDFCHPTFESGVDAIVNSILPHIE